MSRNGKTSTYGWGALLPICRSQIAPGGYSRKFYTGRLPLGVEPLTFLYTFFWQKSYPFRIPFIDKWQYPLHKFSLELCIPFNYCKRTFFLNGLKIELKSKRLLQRLIKQRQKGWGIQYFDWPLPGIGKPGEDWYERPAPTWGICSFSKTKWQMSVGEGHAWNWLSHYLSFVVILTGLQVISDLEL